MLCTDNIKCPNCGGSHIYYIQSTYNNIVDIYCVECNSLIGHKKCITNEFKVIKNKDK